MCSCEIWGCFTLKSLQKWPEWTITSQNKMSNNSKTSKRYAKYVNEPWLWNWRLSSRLLNKNCVKHPLAEKSLGRHFQLAIKPRYLGNHASQLQNYYGTLPGSHGRSFKIRHEQSSEAPPGGEISMTSYHVGNKTSLFRKPCIPDK